MEEPHLSFPSTAPLDHVNAVIMLVDLGVRCNVIWFNIAITDEARGSKVA